MRGLMRATAFGPILTSFTGLSAYADPPNPVAASNAGIDTVNLEDGGMASWFSTLISVSTNMLKLLGKACLGLTLLGVMTLPAHADQPGQSAGGSAVGSYGGSGIDTVNLLSGQLLVKIPLPVLSPQRGGRLSFGIALTANSVPWSVKYLNQSNPTPSSCVPGQQFCVWDNTLGVTQTIGNLDGGVGLVRGWDIALHRRLTTIQTSTGHRYEEDTHYLVTADGARHHLQDISVNKDKSFYATIDGSGYKIAQSNNNLGAYTQATIFDRAGNQYATTWQLQNIRQNNCVSNTTGSGTATVTTTVCDEFTGTTQITDTNGNFYTLVGANGAPGEDTLGRVPPTEVTPGPAATCPSVPGNMTAAPTTTFAALGYRGATQTYTLCNAFYTLQTGFNQSGVGEANLSKALLVAAIMPDGTRYTFNYDSYGNVTYIGLPTGGNIQYTWETIDQGIGVCGNSAGHMNRAVQTRTVNDNNGHTYVWNYTYGNLASDGTITNTVEDPNNNDQVHVFSVYANTNAGGVTGATGCHGLVETETKSYQGHGSSATLLAQSDVGYQAAALTADPDGGDPAPFIGNVFATSVATRDVTAGLTKRVIRTADTGFGAGKPFFGQVTMEQEYDWGSGGPGALLRETDTTYKWQSSSCYMTSNVLDLSDTVIVKDGSGNEISRTTNAYDGNTLVPSGVSVQKQAAPTGCPGNLSAVQRHLNTTNTNIQSSMTVYDTGMVRAVTDPNGNQTTYDYDTTGTYVIKTTAPRTQSGNINTASIQIPGEERLADARMVSATSDTANPAGFGGGTFGGSLARSDWALSQISGRDVAGTNLLVDGTEPSARHGSAYTDTFSVGTGSLASYNISDSNETGEGGSALIPGMLPVPVSQGASTQAVSAAGSLVQAPSSFGSLNKSETPAYAALLPSAGGSSAGAFTLGVAASQTGVVQSHTTRDRAPATPSALSSLRMMVATTILPPPPPPKPTATNGSVTTSANTVINGTVSGGGTSATFHFGTPSHGTVTSNPPNGTQNSTSGAFTYTPNAGYSGVDSFTFSVTNGGGSASATETVKVVPVANAGSVTTNFNTTVSGTLSGTGPGFAIVAASAHGSATVTDFNTGAFTYSPNSGYSGSDSFTFNIVNSAGSSSTVTESVTVNQGPPTANGGSITTTANTAVSSTLSGSGSGSLTFAIVSGPTHGTATITNAATGAFTYTPNNGYGGSDSFTFNINNSGGTSNTATESITVNLAPPTAADGSITVAFNTCGSGTLSGSGQGTLTFAIVASPAYGLNNSLGATTGNFGYCSNTGYVGTDSFTFNVKNSGGTSNTATEHVTVNPPPAPVAAGGSVTTNENSPVTGNLSATGAGPLTFTIVAAPSHGSITLTNATTGAFKYTPNSGYNGTDPFTFQASNAGGPSNTATEQVTVTGSAALPPSGTSVDHISSATYDFNTGLVVSTTDQNGNVSQFDFDIMNRPISTSLPDGGSSTISYPNSNTVTTQSAIDATRSRTATSSIDGLGRGITLQKASSQGTVTVATTYSGLVTSTTNPYFSTADVTYGTTQATHDALGRTVRVTEQDGSAITTSYDQTVAGVNGLCTLSTDESVKSRETCVDGLGRPVAVFEDPAGLNLETDYSYSTDTGHNNNQVVTVTQKGGSSDVTQYRVRTSTYDSLGRLLSAFNPETGTISYTYDNVGNMATKTDSRNIVATTHYDALNRVTSVTYSDSTPSICHVYDVSENPDAFHNTVGRLSATSYGCGNSYEFLGYDAAGRTTASEQCLSSAGQPTNCVTVSQSYDLAGDPAQIVYPNGLTVDNQYDVTGWLTSVANDAASGGVYGNGALYAANGSLTSLSTPNFFYAYTYNLKFEPTQISVGSTNVSLMTKDYSYATGSDNGNVLGVTDQNDATRSVAYAYDTLNRLTCAQAGVTAVASNCGPSSGTWGESFSYDGWGNLTAKRSTNGVGENYSAQIANNNRIAQYTNAGSTFTPMYDPAGNVTNDGISTYGVDGWNRLASVTNANGTVTMIYDGAGRRIQKSSGNRYVYGPEGVLAELDPSGKWTDYVFFGGKRLASVQNSTVNYYLSDALGSTDELVSADGKTVLDDQDYFPYGGIVPGVGKSTSANHYKFTGKERDAESGLDYFGARYYSNALGRWISADWSAAPAAIPYANAEVPQSFNLYRYAGNNPATLTDPDGHLVDGIDVNDIFTRAPIHGFGWTTHYDDEIRNYHENNVPRILDFDIDEYLASLGGADKTIDQYVDDFNDDGDSSNEGEDYHLNAALQLTPIIESGPQGTKNKKVSYQTFAYGSGAFFLTKNETVKEEGNVLITSTTITYDNQKEFESAQKEIYGNAVQPDGSVKFVWTIEDIDDEDKALAEFDPKEVKSAKHFAAGEASRANTVDTIFTFFFWTLL